MSKTMAEVLAEHQDWTYKRNLGYYRSEYLCRCGERFWHGDHAEDPTFNEAVAAHQSAALSAAGFGLVADTKAEALREAAEHFKQRSGTLHNTMLEMTGLPDFTAEDITRYGAYSAEANGTATWLRTKAAVIRNES